MKKFVVTLIKFAVPIAIIAWLVWNIDEQQWQALQQREKNWPLLIVAFILATLGVSTTYVRWYVLVRALNIPFRMRDAFRLGFLGYLLNFVSVGLVGGDLFKAVFIAHENPGRRAEAIATVVVDRMIGLYALLLLTTGAIIFNQNPDPEGHIVAISRLTYLATGIGAIGIMMVIIPGFTSGSVSEFLGGLPKIGPTVQRLIQAVRMYRNKPVVLTLITLMSIGTHSMFACSIYLIAQSLFATTPTLGEHFVIVPLSLVAGALPFTPAGLGTFELAMDYLYTQIPQATNLAASGITVALGYRLVTIGVSVVGAIVYWTSRREVQELMEEARHEHERPEQQGPEQTVPEQQGPEQQGPEQQGPEQQGPEQQGPEQQGPEQQGPGSERTAAGDENGPPKR